MAWHCAPDPGPPGEYFSPYGVVPEGHPTAKNKVGTITDGPQGEYIVDRQAAEAVKFLRENKERPFFLNLWCYGVHGPWGHKPEFTAEFAKKTDPRGAQRNPIMASMLRSVDECFGRILDELEALPGVGHKTAQVVMAQAFEIPAFPVDTHIHRIATNLGLTRRADASWKTAHEITTRLRVLDARDPVRYDFSLCHLGMMGACGFGTRQRDEHCPLKGTCRGK